MSSKMGRPLSDNPRNHKLFIRLTDEENDNLEECCKITNKSTDKILERE